MLCDYVKVVGFLCCPRAVCPIRADTSTNNWHVDATAGIPCTILNCCYTDLYMFSLFIVSHMASTSGVHL